MDKDKNAIDKIDEQIQEILDSEKRILDPNDPKEDENGHVVFVDQIGDGEDTKRLDQIDDLKEDDQLETVEEIKEEKKEEVKEENKVEESTPEQKESPKKKNKLPFIVLAAVLVLILIIILLHFLLPKKEEVKVSKEDTLSKAEQEKIITGYGDALKGIVSIYYDKQKILLEYDNAVDLVKYDYEVKCSEHEIYEDGSVYLNQCTINDKKTSYSYGKKQEKKEEEKPVISDGDIKVYVSKSNKKTTLKEPKDVENYDVFGFKIDGSYQNLELFGELDASYVLYEDEDYLVHMINFRTGKKVLDMLDYTSVLPITFNDEYDLSYIAINIHDKWGIYNIQTNERVVSHRYDSVSPLLSMGVSGPATHIEALEDGVIATVNYGSDYSHTQYGLINYRTGDSIIPAEYRTMYRSGNYLWCIDSYDDGHIFDHDGKELLANQFDTVYGIVDGKYVLVQDKEDTKLVSIKGKELYNYGKISIGSINYGLTYKDGALFQFSNPNKEEGNYETDCVEVIYDSSTKSGEVKNSYCGGIAKPVLYLYPEKTTNVVISFEHPEYLETTYPKFHDKWEVKASKNGDLRDKDGNYYYALYWDEQKVHEVDFSTGYYVEKENAISFLEKKLSYIGLSPRERNEFIMYWLPVLEKNEKSIVYFELTEERESYQKLLIQPKPDSLLRLVIHIKKVPHKVNLPKQNLTKFQRKGFVAVEWGGTTY